MGESFKDCQFGWYPDFRQHPNGYGSKFKVGAHEFQSINMTYIKISKSKIRIPIPNIFVPNTSSNDLRGSADFNSKNHPCRLIKFANKWLLSWCHRSALSKTWGNLQHLRWGKWPEYGRLGTDSPFDSLWLQVLQRQPKPFFDSPISATALLHVSTAAPLHSNCSMEPDLIPMPNRPYLVQLDGFALKCFLLKKDGSWHFAVHGHSIGRRH